jgi:hypothetical protein
MPWITKVLSRVEQFFLKIVWFSFKRRNSSEKIFNLLYNTDVNNFPKQYLNDLETFLTSKNAQGVKIIPKTSKTIYKFM